MPRRRRHVHGQCYRIPVRIFLRGMPLMEVELTSAAGRRLGRKSILSWPTARRGSVTIDLPWRPPTGFSKSGWLGTARGGFSPTDPWAGRRRRRHRVRPRLTAKQRNPPAALGSGSESSAARGRCPPSGSGRCNGFDPRGRAACRTVASDHHQTPTCRDAPALRPAGASSRSAGGLARPAEKDQTGPAYQAKGAADRSAAPGWVRGFASVEPVTAAALPRSARLPRPARPARPSRSVRPARLLRGRAWPRRRRRS